MIPMALVAERALPFTSNDPHTPFPHPPGV